MVKKPATKVPDAWEDDDWEAQADKTAAAEEADPAAEAQVKLSKKERLAQHAESNRKLWESAEAPASTFHYLASRSEPPLASTFKPAVTVLSRRPTPQVVARRLDDPNNPNAANDDDDDDDDESSKKVRLSPEEIRAKQLREREEKQRRYDEVRAKIFGTGTAGAGAGASASAASNPSSGASTPGAVTPPRSSGSGRGQRGGRGRGRGGGYRHDGDNREDRDRDRDRDKDREGGQRPGSGSGRELYDPHYSPKPGFQLEKRGGSNNGNGGAPLSGRSTPRDDDQVIRTPRGPDGNTRGFARRGAKAG